MKRIICLLSVFVFASFSPAVADSGDNVDIEEWQVPWERSGPRDPHVGIDGRIWFVGQRTGYFAYLNPESGDFTLLDLPEGSRPHNLIVGSDGTVWIAGNKQAYIGKYNPATGTLHQIPMPDAAARDPHTLVLNADESMLWFTLQQSNRVGRLNIATEKVDLIEVPTSRSRPYGIRMAPDGTPWIALFGVPMLGSVNPESLELTIHPLPRESTRPRRLEVTPDGRVWYVDYADGMLGALDPKNGSVREWPLPSGEGSRPYGTEMDSKGRIWLVETGPTPNLFIGFDPTSETFFSSTAIPSGGGAVRHMDFDAENGEIWFGTDTNMIGRAKVE